MKKNTMMKIIVPVAALVVVSALFLGTTMAPLQVEAERLIAGRADVTFTEQGACSYQETHSISSMLDGEVSEVLVKEGQTVKAGDTIAVISASNVEYQIQRLQSDIKGYQAQIYNYTLANQKETQELQSTREELQGEKTTLESEMKNSAGESKSLEAQIQLQEQMVAQNRSNVSLARKDMKFYREDFDPDSDDPEYNQLKQALNNAEKELVASEQTLLELQAKAQNPQDYQGRQDALDAKIKSIDTMSDQNYNAAMQSYNMALIERAQVSIAELQEQQGRANVTAPCDGVVIRLPMQGVDVVVKGAELAVIGSDPMVEVYVPVHEMDGIQTGDTVELLVPKRTGDQIEAGVVSQIDSQASIMLSPLGIEESKVRVLVQGKNIGVGYQPDVTFTVYQQENCITVPKKAVFEDLDGQEHVWVVRDSVAKIQPVVTGVEIRGGYIVDEGLVENDIIISDANTQGLEEGKKVSYDPA